MNNHQEKGSARSGITVCITTYKRPELLADLLSRLVEQQCPQGYQVDVLVVDNDPAMSAEGVVQRPALGEYALRYVVEPEKNISAARNRALTEATTDFVLFIDDDAIPGNKEWFCAIAKCIDAADADIVHGPVDPLFDEEVPVWIRRSRYFERPRAKNGATEYDFKGGCNVCIRLAFVKEKRITFDKKFGVTGGEDSFFFRAARDVGGSFFWCDSALVLERYSLNRCNLLWMLRRSFRGGNTYMMLRRKTGAVSSKLIAATIIGIFLGLPALVPAALALRIAPWTGMFVLKKVSEYLGRLAYLVNLEYREYK